MVCVGLLISVSSISYASETQEKMYLVQILNQLNAIRPTILAAKKEQPSNRRVKFHYQSLLEDIEAIKKGINEKLAEVAIEPRAVVPIKGDYTSDKFGAFK